MFLFAHDPTYHKTGLNRPVTIDSFLKSAKGRHHETLGSGGQSSLPAWLMFSNGLEQNWYLEKTEGHVTLKNLHLWQ